MTDDCSNTPNIFKAEQLRTPVASRVDMTRGSLLQQTVYLSWPIVAASLLQVAEEMAVTTTCDKGLLVNPHFQAWQIL